MSTHVGYEPQDPIYTSPHKRVAMEVGKNVLTYQQNWNITLSSFSPAPSLNYLTSCFFESMLLTLSAILVGLVQPYKSNVYNVLDVVLILETALFDSSITIYHVANIEWIHTVYNQRYQFNPSPFDNCHLLILTIGLRLQCCSATFASTSSFGTGSGGACTPR